MHQDPRLDLTDLYVFESSGEGRTVFAMCLNGSAPGMESAEGFRSDAHYDFRIDTDGDAVEDYAFRVVFGEADHGGAQPLELRMLDGADARSHAASGDLIAWGTTDSAISGASGTRVWAGLAQSPPRADPGVVSAVRWGMHSGFKVEPGSRRRTAIKALADDSVCAIVLDFPNPVLSELLQPDGRVALWVTTTSSTAAGGWRPINRMGLPMTQVLFNPPSGELATEYGSTPPVDDRANYGELFTQLIARVVQTQGTASNPQAYAAAVVRRILPDVLPYRIGSPAIFSFATINGRGLADNAFEVMFSIVANCAISAPVLAGARQLEFPYMAPRRVPRT